MISHPWCSEQTVVGAVILPPDREPPWFKPLSFSITHVNHMKSKSKASLRGTGEDATDVTDVTDRGGGGMQRGRTCGVACM